MIDSIDSLSPTISKEWIALILLPTVGSLAECITATSASAKDRLSLSISVAVGSTIVRLNFDLPWTHTDLEFSSKLHCLLFRMLHAIVC